MAGDDDVDMSGGRGERGINRGSTDNRNRPITGADGTPCGTRYLANRPKQLLLKSDRKL